MWVVSSVPSLFLLQLIIIIIVIVINCQFPPKKSSVKTTGERYNNNGNIEAFRNCLSDQTV